MESLLDLQRELPGGDAVGVRTESPRRQVGLRLTVVARMLRNAFDRKVATLGVTRSQWSMIAMIARHPGATQRGIAEHLEMSEASAGRLMDRLCDDGLIERRERRDDRRARSVYLTDKAGPLLGRLGEIAAEGEQQIFAGFSDDEIDQLLGYMNRIYRNAARH